MLTTGFLLLSAHLSLHTSTLPRKADREPRKSKDGLFLIYRKTEEIKYRERSCSQHGSQAPSDLHSDSFRPEGRRGAQPNSLRTETGPDCSKIAGREMRATSSQSELQFPWRNAAPKAKGLRTLALFALQHTFLGPVEVGLLLGD